MDVGVRRKERVSFCQSYFCLSYFLLSKLFCLIKGWHFVSWLGSFFFFFPSWGVSSEGRRKKEHGTSWKLVLWVYLQTQEWTIWRRLWKLCWFYSWKGTEGCCQESCREQVLGDGQVLIWHKRAWLHLICCYLETLENNQESRSRSKEKQALFFLW